MEIAEADIKQVFNYILQRSQNIQIYSNKLREAIRRLDVFIGEIVKETGVYYIHPKKIEYISDPEEWQLDLYIAFCKHTYHSWRVCYGIALVVNKELWNFYNWLHLASRNIIKNSVKLLPEAIIVYSQKLEQEGKQLKQFADFAEKIAELIPPQKDDQH